MIPIPRQAGKAGGTVVVTKSKDRFSIAMGLIPLLIRKGKEITNPTKERIAIMNIYLTESFLNLKSTCFGKSILLIKFPFFVLNAVLSTNAFSPLVLDFFNLFCIIFVPENKMFFIYLEGMKSLLIAGKDTLNIGVDSPVSIASFMITLPFKSKASHGRIHPSSGNSNTSPGTKSLLSIFILFPSLYAKTSH